ncbi:MAG: 6,7-dimethyl-8-ribityllumazine synthase [Rickettsiales bacterium]|nr:6,7-dimethyl-8-ribityllumazine synthase [Rickettsiales bacterium]
MPKILIVQADFYKKISALLLEGAINKIEASNYEYEVITVPGAFEIPAVIAFAEKSKQYDGYVALGCVIRGETTHYDYVCLESARGLNDLAFKENLAIGYGIITVENESQALERADPSKKDKGGFAANACLEMVKIRKRFFTKK